MIPASKNTSSIMAETQHFHNVRLTPVTSSFLSDNNKVILCNFQERGQCYFDYFVTQSSYKVPVVLFIQREKVYKVLSLDYGNEKFL